ncbi:hypothetical protein SMACR_05890 [Sordaria macrospora]|uniref:WGS project CABT00000000 data, contig 2.24 n=2 Tax=Sordaria macrospora TaxID=5147 RepID=F7W3F0_SORMK|nr:uncharacterized protein SMAC_05890 [Sordaria macrospora k-hell]KAA8634323.1 hypothetical protein SMACR_05890 [Sordaria macrospora]KAH7627898.1 hypothetical protein B0T09DRAFT_268958 [Sordaria sp. MPI-SDFR-AT-0083]WPJ65356.1 hypothetical protein SMAC4_05890 [Sordaria macrospora]CCC12152.1 unnamed protein product [Sordaria macrospora k-hell]
MADHNHHDQAMSALQDRLRSVTVSPAVQPNPNPAPIMTPSAPDSSAVIEASAESYFAPRPRSERIRSVPADLKTFGNTHNNTHDYLAGLAYSRGFGFQGVVRFGEEAVNMPFSFTGTTATGEGGAATSSGYHSYTEREFNPQELSNPFFPLRDPWKDELRARDAVLFRSKRQKKLTETTSRTLHVGSGSKVRGHKFLHHVSSSEDNGWQSLNRGKAGKGTFTLTLPKRRIFTGKLRPLASIGKGQEKLGRGAEKESLRARRVAMLVAEAMPTSAVSELPLKTTTRAMELDGQGSTSQQEVNLGQTSSLGGNDGHVSNVDDMEVEEEDLESNCAVQADCGSQSNDVLLDEGLYRAFQQHSLGVGQNDIEMIHGLPCPAPSPSSGEATHEMEE